MERKIRLNFDNFTGWITESGSGHQWLWEDEPSDSGASFHSFNGSVCRLGTFCRVDLGPDWRKSKNRVVNGEVIIPVDVPGDGEPVVVWNNGGNHFHRYSTGEIGPFGNLLCYDGGRTKFSCASDNKQPPCPWECWRRPTPEELEGLK